MGVTGSGKTVTLNRIAYGVATTSDWQFIVIDAKGDPVTQRQFASSMHHAGRDVHLFPQEAYDAWRGTGREIADRLVALIDWAEEGGGAYYRDLAARALAGRHEEHKTTRGICHTSATALAIGHQLVDY